METKLFDQVTCINNHPGIAVNVTDCTIINGKEEVSVFEIRRMFVGHVDDVIVAEPLKTIINLQPFTSSLIVKKSIIVEAGLFDESMSLYEDHDCFCRISLLGGLGITNKSLVKLYRKGRDEDALSYQHTENEENSFLALIRIYNKLLENSKIQIKQAKLVRTKLSSVRFYLGLVCFESYEIKRKRGYILLFQSLKDDFAMKSFFRVFIVLLCGVKCFRWVQGFKLRNKNSFRRSDSF